MDSRFQRITPFLWFDDRAEEAARFYTSIFPNSRITRTATMEGRVMTVAFELDGVDFAAINGGPHFKFNEAISLVVNCTTQAEVDHYWDALSKDGDPKAQQCGWLKDRYGVSWQIVPTVLPELLGGPDPERASRAMKAMLGMKKLDVEALRRAGA